MEELHESSVASVEPEAEQQGQHARTDAEKEVPNAGADRASENHTMMHVAANDSTRLGAGATVVEEEQKDKQQEEQFPVDTYEEQSSEVTGANTQTQYGTLSYAAGTATETHHDPTSSHQVPVDKGLTFSGPPYVPKAKPYARADYSHSTGRLMKIAHDNQLLVQRLTSINRKEPSWAKDLHHSAPCNTASSAVNRRKQAAVIAQENHALYQRLVAIRPSKDISRQTLEAEHRKNEDYRINCATFKPEKLDSEHRPAA